MRLAFVFIVASAIAACGESPADVMNTTSEAQRQKTCEDISGLAGTIMEARQVGVEMSEVMRTEEDDPAYLNMRKALIVDAYDSPQFSTEDYQQKAVTDFKNNTYLACIR